MIIKLSENSYLNLSQVSVVVFRKPDCAVVSLANGVEDMVLSRKKSFRLRHALDNIFAITEAFHLIPDDPKDPPWDLDTDESYPVILTRGPDNGMFFQLGTPSSVSHHIGDRHFQIQSNVAIEDFYTWIAHDHGDKPTTPAHIHKTFVEVTQEVKDAN